MTIGATAEPRVGLTHIQLFAETDAAPVRWRLLGGNNRELGRGIERFEDDETCRRGIDELRQELQDLVPSVQRTASGTWTWQLVRADEVVAISGHQYDRLIRCRQGLAHFVDHLQTCPVGPGLMLTQARRWRSPADRRRVPPVRLG